MTRLDRKLIAAAHKRAHLIERVKAAKDKHKSIADLQARLVDATRQQIDAEIRIERKGRAA